MSQTTNSPLFTDAVSKGYETRALMVKYIRNQLDPATTQKIARLIKECEDCRKLHQEVKAFINDPVDTEFSVRNEVILKDNERFLSELVMKYTNMNDSHTDNIKQEPDVSSDFDIDDHLCCGS